MSTTKSSTTMLKLFSLIALAIGIVAILSEPAPPEVLDTHTGWWEPQQVQQTQN